MVKFKFFIFLIGLNLGININAQSLSYSYFSMGSEKLKTQLIQDNYSQSGNLEHPSFFDVDNGTAVRFYKSTGVIAKFEIGSTSKFSELVKEISRNANFRFKYCSDYDSPVVYSYDTYNGNIIRFDYNKKEISVDFPSSVNSFMNSNSDLTTVFVCLSEGAYAFHTNLKCNGLQNCDSKIAKSNIREAEKYNYKFCEICSTDDTYSEKPLNDAPKKNENYNSKLNLSFLKKYVGGYNFSKICEDESFKKEIQELLGTILYDKYLNYIQVVGPIQNENNQSFMTGCMAHACTTNISSLLLDFNTNDYYIGILDSDVVYLYSNNPQFNKNIEDTYPSEFLEWAKDAFKYAERNK